MGSQNSNPMVPQEPGQGSMQTVEFVWTEPCQTVYLCGSFNGWKERIPLNQVRPNYWRVVRELPPGRYQFKFIVDSQWRCGKNYETIRDQNNNLNNVLVVEDASNTPPEQRNDQMEAIEQLFGTELPDNPTLLWNNYPHELPRQLVKTPLNASFIQKEYTPSILLPLPDHVVLTHFFRQRKRKNYSVCASTYRYRGKYITVVLYITTDFSGQESVPELLDIFNQGLR